MRIIVLMLLNFIATYAIAFSGQPKTIETKYETILHQMKTMRHYRINLPDIKFEEWQCGNQYNTPGRWDLAWCKHDANSSTSCSFKLSEQDKNGLWKEIETYEMVDRGLHQFSSDMFSSILDNCSNGKINATSVEDFSYLNLTALTRIDYTNKQRDPSPDPNYLHKFCINLNFNQSKDTSKHSVLARRCDRYEYPEWTEVETTIVDSYN